MKPKWTPEDVEAVLMDPRNAGALGCPAIVPGEQWVKANAQLIKEQGSEVYLRKLLTLLQSVGGES